MMKKYDEMQKSCNELIEIIMKSQEIDNSVLTAMKGKLEKSQQVFDSQGFASSISTIIKETIADKIKKVVSEIAMVGIKEIF
eukprot:10344229-Ditylum_brightwellii.AAC.1